METAFFSVDLGGRFWGELAFHLVRGDVGWANSESEDFFPAEKGRISRRAHTAVRSLGTGAQILMATLCNEFMIVI